MNGNLDFWSNNFPTTLLQFPVYECMSSVRRKKCHLPSRFATLQYWFIALFSISSAWCNKGPFSAVITSSKECYLVSCREESKCFSYRDITLSYRDITLSYCDITLSATLSAETFTHTTQIRWIITLTFLSKATFFFFRIDWIISLLSNIEGSNLIFCLIW